MPSSHSKLAFEGRKAWFTAATGVGFAWNVASSGRLLNSEQVPLMGPITRLERGECLLEGVVVPLVLVTWFLGCGQRTFDVRLGSLITRLMRLHHRIASVRV